MKEICEGIKTKYCDGNNEDILEWNHYNRRQYKLFLDFDEINYSNWDTIDKRYLLFQEVVKELMIKYEVPMDEL